ncbi:DNA-binding MarR family transcriptional regulator [Parvibaculum indicum]|uniref:MarR family winged helix-turn-helix transcriptional regulator n=1 Tax=Parvibaculum indicum TaxID=562969 RepID=UPI001423F35D|nr:MarR family transcriptional regulator [Parvibaculum indicum]NIJ39759.1 DNA-binding MarR family transcriptional regulator [Parvibaculum indicum]
MDQIDRILDQWRAERPDLDVAPMGTIGRMKRLTAHLAQGMERVFTAHGLNAASFDVLATLRRAGEPYALSPSELIEWTMVTSGTMTNRLDRLEQTGFITRRRNPEDGRGFVIALTEKGHKLIDKAVTAHVENQHAMVEVLSENERKTLDRLLGKWLGAFE